jgi:hypothetical protein
VEESVSPEVLWNLKYQRQCSPAREPRAGDGHVITLKALSADLSFDDEVLQDVKAVWERVTGAEPETFLKFEAREGTFDEDGGS